MKQYTTPEQTAKLKELGFKKPKGKGYTIDEMLKIIPPHIPGKLRSIYIYYDHRYPLWRVSNAPALSSWGRTLSTALFRHIILLRDEGLI